MDTRMADHERRIRRLESAKLADNRSIIFLGLAVIFIIVGLMAGMW